jgi:hypothetical protein
MKSGTLKTCYKGWQETATAEEIAKVDEIYKECEDHYEDGGDVIVETVEPSSLLHDDNWFVIVGYWVEQQLNARFGDDDDPQLAMYKRFKTWKKDRESS